MELIDKDDAVALIKKRKKDWQYGSSTEAKYKKEECDDILSLLDTFEVKEVDLDSDIRTYLTNHFNIYEDGVLQSKKSGLPLKTYDIIKVAKHFFELGLSFQLSWQDVKRLAEIGEAFMNSEESDNLSEEEYYTEILNKFKAQKGE